MLIINRKAKILVNEVIENAGGVTSVVTVREGGREGGRASPLVLEVNIM